MAPKKASLSSQPQCEKAVHGTQAPKAFRPRVDLALACSNMTREQVDKSMEVQKSDVDLDPLTPEQSIWLAETFAEFKSPDFERRFFAPCRLDKVLKGIVMGERPEVSTCFTAYLLEHGVLNNIILILKAAQTAGDFRLVYGGKRDGKKELVVSNQHLMVLSKVQVCCDLLQSLVTDARTARFIRKAIPNVVGIFEGIYFAEDTVWLALDGWDMGAQDSTLKEGDKHAALSALGMFTRCCSAQEKSLIASRKVLLQQVLVDAIDGSDFAHAIINRVITFHFDIVLLPEYPACLLEGFLKVGFKAMEISDSAGVVTMAFGLVSNLFKYKKVTTAQITNTRFLAPLLAMAACPELEAQLKPNVLIFIGIIDATLRPIIETENPTAGFQKLATANPKVRARAKKLRELYGATETAESLIFGPSKGLDNLQEGFGVTRIVTKKQEEFFYEIPRDELEAQQRPCRKCSRSSCPKTESVTRQFKLCSRCRLAIYCSQECQKLAWKEGHRNRCRPGGGCGSAKGVKGGERAVNKS